MGAIFGSKNITVDCNKIQNELIHRGADTYVQFSRDCWEFHNLKNIITTPTKDLAQPIENDNILCLDGRIYNAKDLQKKYLSDCELKTENDEEILLLLLNKYGLTILNKLNGMFAIAYYNTTEEKLYLVRDRFGEKPLYYWGEGNQFAFCSDDRALFKILKLPFEFNEEYKKRLIEDNQSDYDELTTFKNIYQVKASEYLVIDTNNNITNHTWYHNNDTDYTSFNFSNKKQVLKEFENILTDAIKIRLPNESECAMTLSGGIDSTLLYTLAKDNLGIKCKSFTYKNKNLDLDETPVLKRLLSEYNDEVIEIDFEAENWDAFVKSIECLNGPMWTPSNAGYYQVYNKMKQLGVKVVLEGHGPDVALGGYYNVLGPAIGQAFYEKKYLLSYHIYRAYIKILNPALNFKYKFGFKTFFSYIKKYSKPDAMNEHLKQLSKNISSIELRVVEKISSENSIEYRSPYLDYRVKEFFRNLPLEYKINKIRTKAILREILQKHNKHYISNNKKKLGYACSENEFLKKYATKLITYLENDENYQINKEILLQQKDGYSKIYRKIAYKILEEIYSKG